MPVGSIGSDKTKGIGAGKGPGANTGRDSSMVDRAFGIAGMSPEEAFGRSVPGFGVAKALHDIARAVGMDVGGAIGKATGIKSEGPGFGPGGGNLDKGGFSFGRDFLSPGDSPQQRFIQQMLLNRFRKRVPDSTQKVPGYGG